jgi:hypothetical protein
MKNVKSMAGQVWNGINAADPVVIRSATDGHVQYNRGMCVFTMPCSQFVEQFEFQPQNDLEWLACKVAKWNDEYTHVFTDLNKTGVSWCNSGVQVILDDWIREYTRQQWQNKRYELGLDGRPKLGQDNVTINDRDIGDKVAAAFAGMLRSGEAAIEGGQVKYNNKETKMIDLSTAVVGDKFVLNNGKVVSFFARTKMNSICEMEGGYAILYEHDGKFDEGVEHGEASESWRIVAKHDPRHWLKDLPDADLFDEDMDYLDFCGNVNHWRCTDIDGTYAWMCLKMPTLTGDEWKLSKISIVELRAWQAANK